MTSISYSEAKTSEQIKAKKVYQEKIDKANKTLDQASEALSKDCEKYGVFHPKVAEDYKAISEAISLWVNLANP